MPDKFKDLIGKAVVLTVGGIEYRGRLWYDACVTKYTIQPEDGPIIVRFNGCNVFNMAKGDKI